MAKIISGLDELPIFDNPICEAEMCEKGKEILLKNFSMGDIESFDKEDWIMAYADHEFLEGRAKAKTQSTRILESGEVVNITPVYAYIGESYDDAITREAVEADNMLNTLIED